MPPVSSETNACQDMGNSCSYSKYDYCKTDGSGSRLTRLTMSGVELLTSCRLNQGLMFSQSERTVHQIRGLIPPAVRTVDQEIKAVMDNLNLYQTPLTKYLYLRELHDSNEKLFFRVLRDYTEVLMPLVYTPTVGDACLKFSLIYRRPRGLYLSIHDAGHVREILDNWPATEVESIVVTDGERILGLGDLGANGMGIPIGKLALYTALGGIPPEKTLPVCIDVGTNNEININDPLYIGLRQKRVRGKPYYDFVHEFMEAVVDKYGRTVLIQFEDFGNRNAFVLLEKYRHDYCTFNDDIQGTASVAVAGLFASLRITKRTIGDNVVVFQGAGEAALGIADLLVLAMINEGVPEKEAYSKIWMMDSQGLLCLERENMAGAAMGDHKKRYAKDVKHTKNLMEIIKMVKPTILIGASAQPNSFGKDILEMMATFSEKPVIFALSNPTSKAECTAEDAYKCTNGNCVFASGSPFPPVTINGKKYFPGQGNNAYIFPGIALAANACKALTIDENTFLEAAKSVASRVELRDLEEGRVYPPLSKIQEVSFQLAIDVANYFFKANLASLSPKPENMEEFIRSKQYKWDYEASRS